MSTVVDPDTGTHEAAVVDGRDTAAQRSTCANCGAPADAGQLMCLECGSRLALDYKRPPSWALPAGIAAVLLLIAGIGVAIALAAVTGNSNNTTAAAPPAPAAPAPPPPQATPGDSAPTTSQPAPAPTASTPTPAPSGGATPTGTFTTPAPAPAATTGWPPGKSAFTVILASLPSQADAKAKLDAARAAGIATAALLHSDDFPSLRPGYWVVFDGQFDSIGQAQGQAASDRGKAGFADAYPRFVSKDPNAKP